MEELRKEEIRKFIRYKEQWFHIKYDNGLPFTQRLGDNLTGLCNRVEEKKASLMIVDGSMGLGKTTIAVECGDYIEKKEINLNEQIGLGGLDFQVKLSNAIKKSYKVMIYDEAGDFNRRGSVTGFNQMINRIFETFRGFKIIIILCLPSFIVLDKSLFDKGIPRLLIHIRDRNDHCGCFAGYSLAKMYHIRERAKDTIITPDVYNKVYPNFWGHFLNIHPQRSQELDIISTNAKIKTLDNNIESTIKKPKKKKKDSSICIDED
jgi:hypothetical protein